MKELILNQVLTYAIPVIIGAIVVWLQGRSTREQKWAALAGQVAKEAVLIAEKSGMKGSDKLSMAVNLFNARMAEAGKNVTPSAALTQVEAAHNEMTLDRNTAYNDKCVTTISDAPMGDNLTKVYGK